MATTTRESKTYLTAEDKTGGAFASMRREVESTQKRVLQMQAALAGVSAVLISGAFAMSMKKAIDDLAAFKDMAIDAGVKGAANIQQFERAFRMAGVPIADAVGIMQKLSKATIEIKDPTSNAAQAVAALGLKTSEFIKLKPDEQLIAIANASAKFAPSAEKNAVMMELMGKSGANAQKVLAEIAETAPVLNEAINAQADAADRLQDSFEALRIDADQFARDGASSLMPYLQGVVEQFKALKGQQEGTVGFFNVVGRVITFVATVAGNFWLALKDMGDGIGALAAQGAALLRGDFAAVAEIDKQRKATYEQNQKAFEAFNTALATGTIKQAANNAEVEEGTKKQLQYNPALKAATDEYTKLMQAIGVKIAATKEEVEFGRKLTEAEKMLLDIQSGKYDKLTPKQRESLKLKAEELSGLERELQLRKNLMVNLKALEEFQSEYRDSIAENLKAGTAIETSLRDGNAQMRIEIENLGATDAQRQLALLTLEKEIALRGILDEGQRANIKGMYETRKAMLESKAAFEQDKNAFTNVFDTIDGGFKAALQGAKSFGDYIKNGLKNALYELVARPFIIQLAASLTGASGQVVASALGGAGGAGSALGGIGSLFSGGGALGGLGALGSAFGNGATFGSSVGLGGTFANLGAGGGSLGFQAGSVAGAAGPSVMAAIAAYQLYQSFRDKGENPKYRLGFGSAAQGYASDSIFGMQGFQYAQGNDASNQGFRNFQRGLGGLDTQIGGLLTPAQIAAAAGRLNGTTGREFSFPKGDPTASEQLSKEFLQIKYSAVFADFNKGISDAIKNFAGNSEELIKYIGAQVTAYEQLQTMLKEIDNTIAGLSNNGVEALTRTLQSLADNVTSAQEALADARELNDPTKEVAAQKALMDAILNRYNTESKLIQDLADQLASIQSGAFDFGQQMAQRISSVGGDLMRFQDVPGMSKIGRLVNSQTQSQLGRITTLQGQIGDEKDPSRRLGLINSALSVVDQYVSTGQAEIRARYDALSRGQQDMVRIQQDAIAKRISGLQTELDLVSQMQGVAESAKQAIRAITFSGQNPLSAFGRFDLQGQDVASLQNQFRNSTGSARAGAANSLIQAIQGRLSGAGDLFQRPSDEYLNAYNEAMAALAEVQGAAQSDAERAIELQTSIEALTLESNGLTQNLIDYTALMNDALDAFNAQALGFYTDLGQQGTDTYALLEATGQAQLDVATRGLTVAEAQRGLLTEIRNLLTSINDGSGTATIGAGRRNGTADATPVQLVVDGRVLGEFMMNELANSRRVLRELVSTT